MCCSFWKLVILLYVCFCGIFLENLILGWCFVCILLNILYMFKWLFNYQFPHPPTLCGQLPPPPLWPKGIHFQIAPSPLDWSHGTQTPLNRHEQIDSVRYLQGSSTCSNLITISQARIHHLPIELISITSIIWWVREGFKKIPSCPGWLGSEGSIFHKKIKIAQIV